MLYDLNYLGANIILLITEISCLMVASKARLIIASEVTSDLKVLLVVHNNLCCCVSVASKCHYINPAGTLQLTHPPPPITCS